MSHNLLPVIIFFIMFSMGLSLTLQDFKNVAKFPKAFFVGALLQLVSLPALAILFGWIGVQVFSLSAGYAAGLVLIAACPGGITSNLLTHLSKGDTALSVSLTSIVSLLSMATIPLIVGLGLYLFPSTTESLKLDVSQTAIGVFAVTLVPISIGMAIKAIWSNLADRIEPYARNIATLLFALIVAGVIAKNSSIFLEASTVLLPLVVLFNVTTMLFAWSVSRKLRLAKPQATAITYECGLQNGTMAIMIAVNMLNSEAMVIPAALYSVIMFVTAGIYMAMGRRSSQKDASSGSTSNYELQKAV